MNIDQAKTQFLQHGDRWGSLTFIDGQLVTKATRGKTKWLCDCGRITIKETGNVTRNSGKGRTCGKCLEIPAEEMAGRKFGKLRMKNPAAVTRGSAKKTAWLCDCGKESVAPICGVVSGSVNSCGHCNDLTIDPSQKFGKLRAMEPVLVTPQSHKKIEWLCDCGKTTTAQARYVLNHIIKTCSRCNVIEAEEFINRKFNRLTLRDPISVKSGSNKKVWWKCECGGESLAQVTAVVSGRTRSCGKCNALISANFSRFKDIVRKLCTPIQPESVPDCCPKALEVIRKVSEPFRAQCRLCGSEYFPRWSGIRDGISLTCGCSTTRVSSGQYAIHDFIQNELGVKAELEYQIGDLVYDIWVPEKNLVIEYNGLRWHSKKDSKKRDIAKYRNAIRHDKDFVMFFEDEWENTSDKVKQFLANKLTQNHPESLRPSKVSIESIDWRKADPLYESYHYIGKSRAPINYGVFKGDELIGCCSFKRPTRQSSHDWELVRMVMNPKFRVHGIWNKILQKFCTEHCPNSIVSFSDNRLFPGKVYELMGFRLEQNLRPDYYWVKSEKRHHKSALRKTKEEKNTGKTEVELRESQGYRRIWDLGKKSWVLDFKRGGGPTGPRAPRARARVRPESD
jgi:ribosomal protein S9